VQSLRGAREVELLREREQGSQMSHLDVHPPASMPA
jgi:hypothetical protein